MQVRQQDPSRHPSLTVAVCTRDRPKSLRKALNSLLAQDRAADELLVVDNAPEDGGVESLVGTEYPAIRYLRESRKGLDFARNKALDISQSDLVAFLDDDAVAAMDWTHQVLDILGARPKLAALTGRTVATTVETPAQQFFEANGGLGCQSESPLCFPADAPRLFGAFRAPKYLCAISAGAGCNLAVRRRAALEVGGFDEALGVGTRIPGGDENDLMWRLLDRGYEIQYHPRVIVFHEHRREIDGAVRQLAGYQMGVVALLTKVVRQSRGVDRWSAGAFLAWRLAKPGWRLLKRGVGRDPLPPQAIMAMWAASWRGLTAYPASVRSARKSRQVA